MEEGRSLSDGMVMVEVANETPYEVLIAVLQNVREYLL